ncbi:MAG: hypothetical protein V4492_05980 [Chlamydiota bacterium]
MKKIATLVTLALLSATSGLISQAPSPVMPPQSGMANPVAGCSSMSQDEQDFAAKLLDMNNQVVFCSQFSPGQRQQAMDIAGKPDANGNAVSADDAVAQTMQGSATGAGATPKRKPGGACPLK